MMDSEDDKAFKMNSNTAWQIFKTYYEEIIRELNRILKLYIISLMKGNADVKSHEKKI
jgi:hypothetical protein